MVGAVSRATRSRHQPRAPARSTQPSENASLTGYWPTAERLPAPDDPWPEAVSHAASSPLCWSRLPPLDLRPSLDRVSWKMPLDGRSIWSALRPLARFSLGALRETVSVPRRRFSDPCPTDSLDCRPGQKSNIHQPRLLQRSKQPAMPGNDVLVSPNLQTSIDSCSQYKCRCTSGHTNPSDAARLSWGTELSVGAIYVPMELAGELDDRYVKWPRAPSIGGDGRVCPLLHSSSGAVRARGFRN